MSQSISSLFCKESESLDFFIPNKWGHGYGEAMQTREFWREEGFEHVVPKGFGEFPEGFDVRGVLKELAEEVGYESVIDFGCGYGRLCESFDADKYLGIDINEALVDSAKEKFNKYRFTVATGDVIGAEICLAYTVFLHLNDKELHETLQQFRCKWLIVAEILGKEWRRDGLPPVFNRDLADYAQALRMHDFVLHKHVKRGYKRYQEIPWYQGKNTDISFLVFRKCLRNPVL